MWKNFCNCNCICKCDLMNRIDIPLTRKTVRTIFCIFFLEFRVIFENASIVIGHCLTALTRYNRRRYVLRCFNNRTLKVHSTPSLLRKSNLMADNRVHTYTQVAFKTSKRFQNWQTCKFFSSPPSLFFFLF